MRQLIVDATSEKLNAAIEAKLTKSATKVAAKTVKHIETLDRLAAHLEAIDVWTRSEPASRKPRLSRDDIAAAAIRIADAEGFDAVSMRRLAAELDAGTMTLYHYVRTKDELLTLVFDAFMSEVVLPAGERLPRGWRAAISVIARQTRDALRRHPWVLDITDDPSIGPNAMRHFDQSWQALLNDDDYPALAAMVADNGLEEVWSKIHAHARGPERFDRNLARLLSGFEAGFGAHR